MAAPGAGFSETADFLKVFQREALKPAWYEQKLKEQGKAIEVVWFDAGHISSALQTELGITYQEHMLRFAARVLGHRR